LVFGFISPKPQPIQFASFLDRFSVSVQGTNYDLNLGNGGTQYYVTRNYPATVTNGQLNIGMQSGITLAKLAGIVVTSAGSRPGAGGGDDADLALFAAMIDSTAQSRATSHLIPEDRGNSLEKLPVSRLEFNAVETRPQLLTPTLVERKVVADLDVLANLGSKNQKAVASQIIPELDRWFASEELIDSVWN
jgi:hypothetical protein